MHDLSNICTHVIEVIKILLAYMQIVFKDDTIYSETFTVKKLFAFIFGQNFEYCETKILALNQFKINTADIRDLLLIKDLHASHASLQIQIKKEKLEESFANTDYGTNE